MKMLRLDITTIIAFGSGNHIGTIDVQKLRVSWIALARNGSRGWDLAGARPVLTTGCSGWGWAGRWDCNSTQSGRGASYVPGRLPFCRQNRRVQHIREGQGGWGLRGPRGSTSAGS